MEKPRYWVGTADGKPIDPANVDVSNFRQSASPIDGRYPDKKWTAADLYIHKLGPFAEKIGPPWENRMTSDHRRAHLDQVRASLEASGELGGTQHVASPRTYWDAAEMCSIDSASTGSTWDGVVLIDANGDLTDGAIAMGWHEKRDA